MYIFIVEMLCAILDGMKSSAKYRKSNLTRSFSCVRRVNVSDTTIIKLGSITENNP